MISPYIPSCITLALYLLATIAGFCGLVFRWPRLEKWGVWLAITAFLSQTLLLILGFHRLFPDGPSGGAYLQLLAWFFLLCGIIAWLRVRTSCLVLFAAPLSLILFGMSLAYLQDSLHLPDSLTASFYTLHIGALFLSIGLFSLSALAGIIFLFLQKRLKSKKNLNTLPKDMPALSMLDQLNAICVLAGFPLYTLGLFTGLAWSQTVFGATFTMDPKEMVSLVIWLLLATLFHNRLAKGWTGRKPALFSLAIFILCLFSIVAINFFFPTHHAFIRN